MEDFYGSVLIAFVQGAAVGAKRFSASRSRTCSTLAAPSSGCTPFPILTGIGLVLGYALLGAGWLVLKSEGELHDWAYRRIRWLAVGVLAVIFLAFAVTFDYHVLAQSNLYARPWSYVFPVVGAYAMAGNPVGVGKLRDGLPFALIVVFFVAAFLSLGVTFWPYMIPYSRYRGERCGAGCLAEVLFLRRGRSPAGHLRLHDRRLLGLPRQGSLAWSVLTEHRHTIFALFAVCISYSTEFSPSGLAEQVVEIAIFVPPILFGVS